MTGIFETIDRKPMATALKQYKDGHANRSEPAQKAIEDGRLVVEQGLSG